MITNNIFHLNFHFKLRDCSYGGKLGLTHLTEISYPYENLIKLNYIHMGSEPAHLAEISLDLAGISARRDEIFPYERSIPVRRDGIFISPHT